MKDVNNRSEYTKAYRLKNKAKLSENFKKRYHDDKTYKEQHKQLCRLNYQQYKEKWALKREANKEKKKVYDVVNRPRIYQNTRKRRANDVQYKLRETLQCRLNQCLKKQNTSKVDKALKLVGCSLIELKSYIEQLWLPGMTWDNHTNYGWHIDHIKPCASFDLRDPEQQKQCFHYTNLQPLWYKDNISKNSCFEGKRHYISDHE